MVGVANNSSLRYRKRSTNCIVDPSKIAVALRYCLYLRSEAAKAATLEFRIAYRNWDGVNSYVYCLVSDIHYLDFFSNSICFYDSTNNECVTISITSIALFSWLPIRCRISTKQPILEISEIEDMLRKRGNAIDSLNFRRGKEFL